MDTLRQ